MRPARPWSTACARTVASLSCPSVTRTSFRKASPASVSATRRLLRSNSFTPSSRSSCAICRLSGGWEMQARRAGEVQFFGQHGEVAQLAEFHDGERRPGDGE